MGEEGAAWMKWRRVHAGMDREDRTSRDAKERDGEGQEDLEIREICQAYQFLC
jgi:hypothetical protein